MIKKLAIKTASLVGGLSKAIDIRDALVFGGLGLLGYGLWLLRPWLGFAATGAVLMWIGLFIGRQGE